MFHVKPSPDISVERVTSALADVGLCVTPPQAQLLGRHAALMLEVNESLNLTRIVDAEDVIFLHIVDSLAFVPLVGDLEAPILDVGSGAGYPGIPLAIMGFDVVLCESVKKKAAFLAHVVDVLGLATRIEPLRAEELATLERQSFGTVVSRAVSALGSLEELAAPLLREGGTLAALKGVPTPEEVSQARRVAALVGLTPKPSRSYTLPRGERRMLFAFEKTGSPRIDLPRRPGMAQRQPLG